MNAVYNLIAFIFSSGCEEDGDGLGNYMTSSPMQGLTITSSTPNLPGPSSTTRVVINHKMKYVEDDEPSPGMEEPKRQRIHQNSVRFSHREDSFPNSPDTRRVQDQSEVTNLLQQLLDVEREHLEVEKQRLEFDRKVGCQLMALIPLVGSILQNQFLLQHQQQQQQQQEQPHEAPTPSNNSREESDQDSCDDEDGQSSRDEVSNDVGCGILQSFENYGS